MVTSTAEDLARQEEKGLLRFLTAGSVDDGKSTLIGRLLFDSKRVYDDHLRTLHRDSQRKGSAGGEVDYSLLVDGLRAEREQGITIDVAYRYFSTPRRKFIIADTPGHEQYTRNMATGASTADLAVILVDARHGVVRQTRRHSFIASLLGIKHLVVAVNKMDLVGWDQGRFETIRDDFTDFAARLDVPDVHFIPISALLGDNVVDRSENMPWYGGGPFLDYLETVHIAGDRNLVDLRFPVQYVVRPDTTFRGYCGTVASGTVRPGDEVMILPSGRRTRVARVCTWDGDLDVAFPPMGVTLTLEDDLDVGRGDMVVRVNNLPRIGCEFDSMVVWMSETPLREGGSYLLKHTTATVGASAAAVRYRVDVTGLHRSEASSLGLNEIGRVLFELRRPVAYDVYRNNRSTGSFIVIDPRTNDTVGAGMIVGRRSRDGAVRDGAAGVDPGRRPVGVLVAANDPAWRRAVVEEVARRLRSSARQPLLVDGAELARAAGVTSPSPDLLAWLLGTAAASGVVPIVDAGGDGSGVGEGWILCASPEGPDGEASRAAELAFEAVVATPGRSGLPGEGGS